jgi:hypothetical protein
VVPNYEVGRSNRPEDAMAHISLAREAVCNPAVAGIDSQARLHGSSSNGSRQWCPRAVNARSSRPGPTLVLALLHKENCLSNLVGLRMALSAKVEYWPWRDWDELPGQWRATLCGGCRVLCSCPDTSGFADPSSDDVRPGTLQA